MIETQIKAVSKEKESESSLSTMSSLPKFTSSSENSPNSKEVDDFNLPFSSIEEICSYVPKVKKEKVKQNKKKEEYVPSLEYLYSL